MEHAHELARRLGPAASYFGQSCCCDLFQQYASALVMASLSMSTLRDQQIWVPVMLNDDDDSTQTFHLFHRLVDYYPAIHVVLQLSAAASAPPAAVVDKTAPANATTACGIAFSIGRPVASLPFVDWSCTSGRGSIASARVSHQQTRLSRTGQGPSIGPHVTAETHRTHPQSARCCYCCTSCTSCTSFGWGGIAATTTRTATATVQIDARATGSDGGSPVPAVFAAISFVQTGNHRRVGQ